MFSDSRAGLLFFAPWEGVTPVLKKVPLVLAVWKERQDVLVVLFLPVPLVAVPSVLVLAEEALVFGPRYLRLAPLTMMAVSCRLHLEDFGLDPQVSSFWHICQLA